MTLISLVFLLGCLLLSALTLVGAFLVSRRARRVMEDRLALVGNETESAAGQKKQAEKLTQASEQLAESVRRVFAFGMSRTWGMHASGLKLLMLATIAAGLSWLFFHFGIGFSNLASMGLALFGFFALPHMLTQMEQHRSELQFMDLFPNAIDMVVRMLKAGMPITAAIRSVGHEAPPPVNEVFALLADQVEIGIPFEDALTAAGQTIGLSDFRFFAVAISLQRTSGGNLVTTLETLSDIIRRRRATRMKAKAATAEVRMSTYILAAIPFFVIGGLVVLSPGYLTPLIVDPRGNVIVGIALGMLLLGFLTMRHMMRSAMRV